MSWRTPLVIAAVYAALFCSLCAFAGHALAAPPHAARCTEDAACWMWPTMGNHRRGIVATNGRRYVVGPCGFTRAHIDWRRTPHLRGDWLARRIGCTR